MISNFWCTCISIRILDSWQFLAINLLNMHKQKIFYKVFFIQCDCFAGPCPCWQLILGSRLKLSCIFLLPKEGLLVEFELDCWSFSGYYWIRQRLQENLIYSRLSPQVHLSKRRRVYSRWTMDYRFSSVIMFNQRQLFGPICKRSSARSLSPIISSIECQT